MIVFDRFLCCISLKSFGKFIGWMGTMASFMLAYALFLILTAQSVNLFSLYERYFGGRLSNEGVYWSVGVLIGVLCLAAVIHILLICGIKYKKSLAILPYVFLLIACIVCTGALICITPSSEDKYSLIATLVGLFVFSIYVTLCIYSLYEIINIEEKRRKSYEYCDTVHVDKFPQ